MLSLEIISYGGSMKSKIGIVIVVLFSLFSCATNQNISTSSTLVIGSFRFIDKSRLSSIFIRHADGIPGMPISGNVLDNGDYYFKNLKPGKYYIEQLRIKVPGMVSSTLRDLYLGNSVKKGEWEFEVKENDITIAGLYQIKVTKDKVSDVLSLGYGNAKATIGKSNELINDVIDNVITNINDPLWQEKLKDFMNTL
jgi:hypothetical protein